MTPGRLWLDTLIFTTTQRAHRLPQGRATTAARCLYVTNARGIPKHSDELYQKAKCVAALRPATDLAPLLQLDSQRLVHELQVHQIELEMQNEELKSAATAQERLLNEYTALYDFAPVGYLSLDRKGRVIKSNLAGAAILGLAGRQVGKVPFIRFVAPKDRHVCTAFLERCYGGEVAGRITCELELLVGGGATTFAQVEAQANGAGCQECQLAVVDVTPIRRQEQKFRQVADELAESLAALETLTAELNMSEERERRRLALVLHDNVLQKLAISKLTLGNALHKNEVADHPVLHELQKILASSIHDLRELSHDLSPPILYDLGLRAAIANTGLSLGRKFGFRFALHTDCPVKDNLSENLSVCFFQFYRELLMNIIKHARAEAVTVTLSQKEGRRFLTVEDDGIGFDTFKCHAGFGLANIKQRVGFLRGSFTTESRVGAGTRSEISIDTNHYA
jgi:signal transduction histidine kinase